MENLLQITEEATLEEKRTALVNWIIALCEDPIIGHSEELKEFLAYDTEVLSTFTKRPPSRIDQVLAKKVSGVFHSIKDALPTFEDDNLDSLGTESSDGNKGFLLPGIFPTTPSSPSKETQMTTSFDQHHQKGSHHNCAPSKKVSFNFQAGDQEVGPPKIAHQLPSCARTKLLSFGNKLS
jgi:hypothetical protein